MRGNHNIALDDGELNSSTLVTIIISFLSGLDDDFEAFCVAAKTTGLAEVRVIFTQNGTRQTNGGTEQPVCYQRVFSS